MQAETIMTIPLVALVSGGRAVPTEAKIVSQANCHRAPMNMGQRLPYLSTA